MATSVLEQPELFNKELETRLSTLSRQFEIRLEDTRVQSSGNVNQHFQSLDTRILEIKRVIQGVAMAAKGGVERNMSHIGVLKSSSFTHAHLNTPPYDLSRIEDRPTRQE